MVRISQFESTVSSANLTVPRTPGRPLTSPITQGLERLDRARKRNDQIKAGTFQLEAGASLTEQAEAAFLQAQNDAPLGEFDAEAFLTETFDPLVEQLAEGSPNDEGARLFRESATRIRSSLSIRGGRFAAASEGEAARLSFENARDSLANSVLSNPDLYESALGQIDEALAGADEVLPADAIADYRTDTRSQIAGARVLGEIRRDPTRALDLLNSGELDDVLDPNAKASLLDSAFVEQRRLVTAAEEAEKPTEAFKEASGRLTNEMLIGINQGTVTADDIRAANGLLTRQDQRVLVQALGDQVTPTTDPLVFANLYERALGGEDITTIAGTEFRNGRLARSDYVALVDKVLNRPGPEAIYTRTSAALSDRLRPSTFEQKWDRESAQIRRGNAIREFDEWVAANSNASDAEYWDQVDKIGERWSLGATSAQRATTLPLPMFFQGTRTAPDLDGSQLRIDDHFRAKHQGDQTAMEADPDFRRQTEILQRWRDFVAAQQQ